jgi:hypothetical protein
MKPKTVTGLLCFAFLISCAAAAADSERNKPAPGPKPPEREFKVVDKWRGTWDVRALRRHPLPVEDVTYTETFEWVLDAHYLRSETTRKSDGGKSMSMVWFDMLTKSYHWVIFDASGLVADLPPPTWSDEAQTMEWKSGIFSPLSYTGYAKFTEPDTIQWAARWKDWKGTVILDIEGTSTRRK